MGFTGHCLCGAVTYTIDAEKPILTGYDHCDACQRQTGSTYSLVTVFPTSSVKISGPLKSYAGKADSGNTVQRMFCGTCGSPIAHEPEGAGITAIKAGTLDMKYKMELKPDTEIWMKGKLPFMKDTVEEKGRHQEMP